MDDSLDDIAVIGMAGRFPGADSIVELWDNLAAGRESIDILSDAELDAAGVPAEVYRAEGYVRACPRLADVQRFDAELFGYSPREAALLDPQSRVSLELAWHALEDAGYGPLGIGASVGVFATASLNTYLLQQLAGRLDSHDFILGLGNVPIVLANAPDFIATRLSYKLDLRGPSVAVQTACSSSLTAIHLARQSILNGECDMALAGGVSIYLPQERGYQYQDGMMLSRDGHCRAFDENADGVLFGRGGGFVVLKPLAQALADGDRVRAIIRGSAVNNDGSGKVGFTAPSIAGQARVIAEALADAGVNAETISYIEAHGTGTRLGDPIEVAGLTEAFRAHTTRQGYCALGTVKTNFGHLDVAAGVTGFIKTVLMLEHAQLVPSLNFSRANPAIDLERSPFRVNTALRAWETDGAPRRAGVSAFGMGGTNAHVILEQAPRTQAAAESPPSQRMHVLRLSAQSSDSLNALAGAYAGALRSVPLADTDRFCFAANTGRAHLPQRLVVRASSAIELSNALDNTLAQRQEPRAVRSRVVPGNGDIAFLFPGMGAQFAGMGRELFLSQQVFRQVLQTCDALLRTELAVPLLEVLFPAGGASSPIDETAYAQPALFAFEVALAKLWESWGIRPAAVIGHSLGEFAAACIAGLLPLEEALRIVAARGRLMGSLGSGGAMCAVLESEEKVASALVAEDGAVSIASINGPANTVISGDAAAVGRVAQRLLDSGIQVHPLNVRNAFHCHLLDPMLDAFENELSKVRFGRTAIPLMSNLTGKVLGDEGSQPRYWRRHAREAVRFAEGIRSLYERGVRTFLEIGPHTVASGMAAGCLGDTASLCLSSLRRGRDDSDQLFEALSTLYVRGAPVDWSKIGPPQPRRHMTMPLYPFARTRYWLDAPAAVAPAASACLPGLPMLARLVRSPLHSATTFELRVDVASHDFLADHRIGSAQVFPATGYLEVALEAAAAAGGPLCKVIDNLEILQPLTEAESPLNAQMILFAEDQGWRFELHALPGGAADWRQYARGRLSPGFPGASVPTQLSELRARCTESLSGEAYYEQLAAMGYSYGAAFRGIESLQIGQDECLAEVRCPAALLPKLSGFHCHPALFDSCLQTVLSLVPEGRNFLPTQIGKVAQLAPLTTRMFARAQMTRSPDSDASLVAEVQIMDTTGALLMEVSGIVLRERRAASTRPIAARASWEDWLYEIGWRSAPQAGIAPLLPAPAALRTGMIESLALLRGEMQLQDYEEIQGPLDAACAEYVTFALRSLGWQPRDGDVFTTAELSATLGVLQKHRVNLHRLLEMLAEEGLVERPSSDRWRVRTAAAVATASLPDLTALRARYPRFDAMFEMVERCGRALASGLRGNVAIVDLLFPGGSLADMERLYHRSPFAEAYNRLTAQIVESLAGADSSAPLRVLEVGAGTGGTSGSVLPMLPAHRTRYVYTDVSPLFLARAEERFAQYPFIEYRVYDVERDPVAQGLANSGYDLIIASNVLHTAADLLEALQRMRGLLAPGGQLLLVEGIARQRWVDLLFGLTDGWWRFADHALRTDYPLLSQSAWTGLLQAAGFEGGITLPGGDRAADLFHQAVILARRPLSEGKRRCLIVTHQDEPFAHLIETQLAAAGNSCTQVNARSVGRERELTAALAAGSFNDILFLATDVMASDPAAEAPDTDSTHALLTLVQSLAAQAASPAPRLWVISCGARAVLPRDHLPAVNQAALWGLADVITLEQPQLRCSCIDLEHADEAAAATLLQELTRESPETRLAVRDGIRYVARLTRGCAEQSSGDASQPTAQQALSIEPGLLDAMQFADVSRRAPGARQVEIQVHAAGLNFKDVLTALGRFDVPAGGFGHECAGEIVAVGSDVREFSVGDAVMAFAPGSLADYVLADAAFVARKPSKVSFEQAAAFSGAFLTAHHALFELAKLRRGDSVLIHAASGGVGLAALQLAQRTGAEIYATAGSDAKRAHLRALGVQHVFDSRSAAFAAAIRAATGGRGVDVVLNSLTGDALVESRQLLAAGGRFIELGRGHAQIDECAPGAGHSYFNPDVAAEYAADPARYGPVYGQLVERLLDARLEPLPCRVFERTELPAAFRLMARAGHIGKVVMQLRPPRVAAAAAPVVSAEACYLIVGGLGDLGLLLAQWLVDRGARHLALMSRREPGATERAAVARLEARGSEVRLIRGDIAVQADATHAIDALRNLPQPLRGVFHAAGLLDDGVLEQQTWRRFERVFAPKVTGAWNLHRLTRDLPMDFFVLFSSVASLLGSPGQSNHAAANAYLDALAWQRRADGLPALSINWGAWSSIGAAARGGVGSRLALRGIGEIAPHEGLAALERLLVWPRPQIGVVPIDWSVYRRQFTSGSEPAVLAEVLAESSSGAARSAAPLQTELPKKLALAAPRERRALLLELIRSEVIKGLGLEADRELPITEPLSALGVDSLLAVELRNALSRSLGLVRRLPATMLFDYPSISALADYLLANALASSAESTVRPVTHSAASDEAAIASMSDEEAEALLIKELG